MTGTTGIPVGASVRSTELWFKTSSASPPGAVPLRHRGDAQQYGLWLDAGWHDHDRLGPRQPATTRPSPCQRRVNDGAWHHVVQTYNGTTLTLYIDGVALPRRPRRAAP